MASAKRVRDLAKWDQKYIWHPFTQMKEWMSQTPLIIERGKGPYLYDTKGRKYIDGVSSLWVNVHGHRVPEIDRAIQKQLKKIAHTTLLGLGSPPSILLAKKLIEIAPRGLKKVFFSDNGSTAVEVALKIAFQYWQQSGKKKKTKFITFTNAYHGDTIGSVSLGGIDLFHKIYKPLLFKSIKIPFPHCARCPYGEKPLDRPSDPFGRGWGCRKNPREYPCVKDMSKIIRTNRNNAAALITEPLIQGAAGMISMPIGYLSELRRATRENSVLLIADEVATGFGRTGTMFACEHEDVIPDLMSVSKGLSGGYLPIAATLATEKIFRAFLGDYSEFKTFFHGHTYTGNPLAAAASLANLELMKRKSFWKRVRSNVALLRRELEQFKDLPNVREVRQCGMMVGIELRGGSGARLGHKVAMKMRKHGVILRPLGNVVVLMTPLMIPNEKIRSLLNTLNRLLH